MSTSVCCDVLDCGLKIWQLRMLQIYLRIYLTWLVDQCKINTNEVVWSKPSNYHELSVSGLRPDACPYVHGEQGAAAVEDGG